MTPPATSGTRTPAAPGPGPGLPAGQQPPWPDAREVARVEAELAARPGLVDEDECAALTEALSRAERGDALVLQAGDCAERFADSAPDAADRRVDHLYATAGTLASAAGAPVVPVGRMAGQYAKPRTSPVERAADGALLPVYRGDAVNAPEPRAPARVSDAGRLLAAYGHAEAVLARVRASWAGRPAGQRLYVSHEALLVPYEAALERPAAARERVLASSGHTVWIGDRTRQPDGWHVRWAARLANPVGVKLGPTVTPGEAVRLSRVLNPEGAPGKLLFVVRLGAGAVRRMLPGLVAEVARRGAPVLWLCDPLHGNTRRLPSGVKTRLLEAVHEELLAFVRLLRAHRQWPAGLHLETTPENVTECVALPDRTPPSAMRVAFPRYRSACDPRLNLEQAAELVTRFGRAL